jgi:D-glycero-D-manno-heptose 1,7-bisphosphate phosphatase
MPSSSPITQAPRKALFLDRDGVINEDTGYPIRPADIVFRPGIFDFCRAAAARGYLLVVVTNQSGVARGYFTEDDVKALHAWMAERFREQGVELTAFYYCPNHRDAVLPQYREEAPMRKPNPGMILQAAKDLGLDIGSSVMIGDNGLSDRIKLDSLRCIIIKSKYATSDYDVETLDGALALI